MLEPFNPHLLSTYDYKLPEELIASKPIYPRDKSRLLVIDRAKQTLEELRFEELADLLKAEDELVFNDTKVIPARIYGKKTTGAAIELLLTRFRQDSQWECLARPGKKLPPGTLVEIGPGFAALIIEDLEGGGKLVQFQYEGDFEAYLKQYGEIPLPHYMKRSAVHEDQQDYQTVYAKNPGASAAPTAGLHFTVELLEQLKQKRVKQTTLTLHTGVGTFKPVKVDDIREHQMHTEQFFITEEAAKQLNQRTGHTQICVGTTTCRALESSADERGVIHAGEYDTNIFIYPGYKFKYVNKLLTNFHFPKSTLLMLVCAFGGYELIMEAYAKAVKERFRFYSYGDAMLIL